MLDNRTNKKTSENRTRLLILSITISLAFLVFLIFILCILNIKFVKDYIYLGFILILLLLAVLLFLLIRFFKAIELVDKSAYIFSKGDLNISDILTDKTKGLETLTMI